MGKCLFVTGTGTDVGKTYVTGLIVKSLRDAGMSAGYYKAAVSGATMDETGHLCPDDAAYVDSLAGLHAPMEKLVSFVYPDAVSPHLAAKLSHVPLDMEKVQRDFYEARDSYDYLTVEGSGGIVCPLRWDAVEHIGLDDLVRWMGIPVLVVAGSGLGTINATVLTVEHLHHCHIPVRGIVLNRFHKENVMEQDNLRMVEEMTSVPVLATVCDGAQTLDMDIKTLSGLYD
ncbi:MAG: dethiobiotin synthase [Selenomonadaceae bacterium]|nr:dethiobiotin synthase [Selenomonadaceae bacterium]